MGKTLSRHMLVGALAISFTVLFYLSRSQWDTMHAWNRAFADVSLLFLSIIMLLGALSKVLKALNKWLVWRRDFGIWAGVTAIIHLLIILNGWVEWQLFRFFYVFSPFVGDWVLHPGFALGNIIGIVALVYIIILTITSNEISIRLLGRKSWLYVQQKAHILYLLVILHTAYFLFFHNPNSTNWLRTPFVILIVGIWLTHLVVFFIHTKRMK
ncbi:ferric reductase-like transmembrane domain-containing protein [Anaerobacillus isosaccharinicus]|uniref:Ferric reductase-like transmembrane domain-containing protein n=1 Tax=Anaerobacillus isosaccharinicus TaxID=1532552 RepID=A0A1S2L593_9BACI|nr:ferric reductase-like transmembrane domain-containing protein [Anaerobacillus isosaccharinicus]MBA5584747.1 ferric reductase-like transmembrane domain-containing protein [Anaerobacillus isosaccharinicus]QOY36884.1 ferric reductase-like transmembrane domain-containing protein [Anaerobacillus isosaccharinicus]